MKDRARLNNGKSSKMMCPSSYSTLTWEQFRALLVAGTAFVDITANNTTGTDAGVSEVGTAINKANILTDATAQKFGYQSTDNATPNDVLGRLGDSYTGAISLTLSSANWVGNSAPYTQTIVNANIKGVSSIPRWTVNPSSASGASAKQTMIEQAGYIGLVQTTSGQVTFTCYESKPTVNIVVLLGE